MLVTNIAGQQANTQNAAEVSKKANYAVINLKCGSGVTEGDGELISDRLRAELFNTGNVNVMERNQMQDILKEQGFQQSGATCTDEACLVQMGQLLGVQYLIAGSLGKLGSMYMVNIRSIDVQTGKITSAVSVDIKGDIEDLVEKLPDIALKLTGAEKKTETPKAPEVKEPEPVKEAEPEPVIDTAKAIEQEVSEKEEEEPKVVEKAEVTSGSSRSAKNKNRSGIGLFFNLSGKPEILHGGNEADTIFLYHSPEATTGGWWMYTDYWKLTAASSKNFGIRFYIKAGQYVVVELGPAFTLASSEYTASESRYNSVYSESYLLDLKFAVKYMVPAVHLGVNFVKRWYPLKINVGAFANFSFPITNFEYSYYEYYNSISGSDDGYDVDFAVSFGGRAGVEIMAGPNVGFSVDFLLNWLKWETVFDFEDSYDSGEPQESHEISFPKIGVGFGVNFYF